MGATAITGRTEDISEGGVLALLDAAPPAGTEVTLAFALPTGGQMMELAAKTTWTRPARNRRHVAGLTFIALPAPAATAIREYVALASFLAG